MIVSPASGQNQGALHTHTHITLTFFTLLIFLFLMLYFIFLFHVFFSFSSSFLFFHHTLTAPSSLPQSSSVCTVSFTLSGFAMLQLYSPLQEALTQAGLYWFFAASSFMTIIFTFLCVTETKKMSIG